MILPNLIQSLLVLLINIVFAWILLEGRKELQVLIVIGINIFQILVSILGTKVAFFFTMEQVSDLITQGSGLAARSTNLVVTNTLYIIAAYILAKYYKNQIRLTREECTIVLILYCLLFGIAFLSIVVMEDTMLDWWWQMAFLILDGMMLLANVIVVYLVERLNKQKWYQMENAVLKLRVEQQQDHITQEKQKNQEIRVLRHDMKRYFVTYLQLLRNGQYQLVERDIEQVLGDKLEVEQHYYTENEILNTVINEKAQKCRDCNIRFDSNVEVTGTIKQAMETGIVLSNLMDNAIEAELQVQEEKRHIGLAMKNEGEVLHLLVKNYIAESVLSQNPSLSTSKKDAKYHGIGLVGVRQFVQQNRGEIDIFEEDDFFVVHVCIDM
jgi:hypothetical protein